MRIRSPSNAPPVCLLEGSTAIIPVVSPCSARFNARAFMMVDFPAPGGPVIPILGLFSIPDKALSSRSASNFCFGRWSSMRLSADAIARRSPASICFGRSVFKFICDHVDDLAHYMGKIKIFWTKYFLDSFADKLFRILLRNNTSRDNWDITMRRSHSIDEI